MIFDFSPRSSPEPQEEFTREEVLVLARTYLDKQINEASLKAFTDEAFNFSLQVQRVSETLSEILNRTSDSPRIKVLQLETVVDDADLPRGIITALNVGKYIDTLRKFKFTLQPITPLSPPIHRK